MWELLFHEVYKEIGSSKKKKKKVYREIIMYFQIFINAY